MRKHLIFVVFRYADWVLTQFHLTFALLVFPSAMQRYIILGKYPNLTGFYVCILTFVMFGGSRSVLILRPINV